MQLRKHVAGVGKLASTVVTSLLAVMIALAVGAIWTGWLFVELARREGRSLPAA